MSYESCFLDFDNWTSICELCRDKNYKNFKYKSDKWVFAKNEFETPKSRSMSTQIKMSIFKLTASSKSELIKIYILFQISV